MPNTNTKRGFGSAGLILVILIILGGGAYIWSQKKVEVPLSTSIPAVASPGDNQIKPIPPVPSFSPLSSSISSTQNIRIDLQYEEPKYSKNVADYPQSTGTYTDPSTGEQYLLLSKKINTSGYGDREYPIFQGVESHSYQGTPIYLSSVHNNQFLSYIGLKINDPSLISNIRVELGVDYLTRPIIEKLGFVGNIFGKLVSWLSTKTVEACGPGIYLRNVGDSHITYIGAKDGISWFKLDKEISVSDIPLSYCNGGDCGGYNNIIEDLSGGNLRMHINYIPTGNKGILKIQLADAVFHNNQNGNYSEAYLDKSSSDMYRAILSDQEYGSLAFVRDVVNPAVLDLVLTNKGNDPIIVDDYSFNRIKNSYIGKQAVGFVIRDSQNTPSSHISFDTILGQTKGKMIQPGNSLSAQVFSATSIQDGLYTISIEYASSTSQAPIAPRVIYWDFYGNRIFFSKDRPIYAFAVVQSGIRLFSLFAFSSSYYLAGKGSYNLKYLVPSASDYPDFAQKTEWNNQSILRQISINDVQNNAGSLWGGFIPSMISSEFFSSLGIQPTSILNDFDGNKIEVYQRNQMTGYVVERSIKNYQGSDSIHGSLVYEIPTNYLTDNLLAQTYLFTIKSVSSQINAQ